MEKYVIWTYDDASSNEIRQNKTEFILDFNQFIEIRCFWMEHQQEKQIKISFIFTRYHLFLVSKLFVMMSSSFWFLYQKKRFVVDETNLIRTPSFHRKKIVNFQNSTQIYEFRRKKKLLNFQKSTQNELSSPNVVVFNPHKCFPNLPSCKMVNRHNNIERITVQIF